MSDEMQRGKIVDAARATAFLKAAQMANAKANECAARAYAFTTQNRKDLAAEQVMAGTILLEFADELKKEI